LEPEEVMKPVLAAILFISICIPMIGQTPATPAAATTQAAAGFPDFTMIVGKRDRLNLPTTGASLCVLPEKKICYQMPTEEVTPSGPVTAKKDQWQFGLNPHSERITVPNDSWIVFTAAYYGGAETFTRLSILNYKDGQISNLVPYLGITELGEYAMWNVPQISPYPILVIADAPHDVTVTLASIDPQPFTVSAWKFDTSAGTYKQAFTYQTTRQYRGGSRISHIGVLGPERDEILRRLMQK
jgi:hypothetical protein